MGVGPTCVLFILNVSSALNSARGGPSLAIGQYGPAHHSAFSG